eukprot:TRINITY_DN13410_c0_g1_i1.p2 TRINITY_DN13410_c0_g1~~TRINITY_DN13410_c0_g1_i1.p2  ORF type:complete len:104 (-),score=28.28 TRINITY_DN13410_c0_g1_i1:5-316(-)
MHDVPSVRTREPTLCRCRHGQQTSRPPYSIDAWNVAKNGKTTEHWLNQNKTRSHNSNHNYTSIYNNYSYDNYNNKYGNNNNNNKDHNDYKYKRLSNTSGKHDT